MRFLQWDKLHKTGKLMTKLEVQIKYLKSKLWDNKDTEALIQTEIFFKTCILNLWYKKSDKTY